MPIHHSVYKNPFETKRQEVDWIDGLPYSHGYDDRFFQADAIKEIKDIFITPGTVFGSQGEGYIRFSLCVTSEIIKEAIARI